MLTVQSQRIETSLTLNTIIAAQSLPECPRIRYWIFSLKIILSLKCFIVWTSFPSIPLLDLSLSSSSLSALMVLFKQLLSIPEFSLALCNYISGGFRAHFILLKTHPWVFLIKYSRRSDLYWLKHWWYEVIPWCYVIYQTRKTVFDHISKQRNTTHSGIFLTNYEVFGNVVKHCLECLIYELFMSLRKIFDYAWMTAL